jgi:integrase
MKKKLTVRGINALKPADSGDDRKMIWDTEVPNFGVRVTETGKISFIVMRRLGSQGAPVRRVVAEHRCGAEYTEGLLTQARDDARAFIRLMAQGVDPKAKAETDRAAVERDQAERAANSFEAVAEIFIDDYVLAKERGKPNLKSGMEVAATIRREIIPRWKDRPITEISLKDVTSLLRDVKKSRPAVARHLLAYLSKMFNWAVITGNLQASPIVRGIGKTILGKAPIRARILTESEIVEVWKASAALPSPFGAFVRMLLATGQRLREVANAKWSEIDLDARLWTVPAARMKGDAAHEVALAPLAIEILGSLTSPEARKPGAYVFSTTGGSAPISGFSKAKIALDRLINEARAKGELGAEAIEPFVFHDLRRTMRTALSGLPVPNNVAELVIAHAKEGLDRVYDQHAYRDEKRRALDLWASKLLSIVEPERDGKVVELAAVRR